MIDLYSFPTPNGHKVSIMLEECGLPYRAHKIDITKGEQFDPDFLAIAPNNRIPAIVDADGPDGAPISVFESGAILQYLAEKTGKFMPTDARARVACLEWLNWQMGGLGPMLGQAHHFRIYAPEQVPYGIERYTNEANRLYRVIDKRLSEAPYLAGDEYSIADMACWGWMRTPDRQGVDIDALPHAKAWHENIAARPAVQRAVALFANDRKEFSQMSEEEKAQQRESFFGAKQRGE